MKKIAKPTAVATATKKTKTRTKKRMGVQARVEDMANKLRRFNRADSWLLASLLEIASFCDVAGLKTLLRAANDVNGVTAVGWWEHVPDSWDAERMWPACRSQSQERLRAQGAKILRTMLDNQEAP